MHVANGDLYVISPVHNHALVDGFCHTLGVTGITLAMCSEKFKGKALDKLIGDGEPPKYINEDPLGRCSDTLYDYGVSKLFPSLVMTIPKSKGFTSTKQPILKPYSEGFERR